MTYSRARNFSVCLLHNLAKTDHWAHSLKLSNTPPCQPLVITLKKLISKINGRKFQIAKLEKKTLIYFLNGMKEGI
jgi:hypothetical protein